MTLAYNEDSEPSAPLPVTHPPPPIKMWTFTIFLTPVVAWALAIFRYIPFDPTLAAINGFLFSLVYVGYRVYYWRRSYRKYQEWKKEGNELKQE